MYKIINQIDDLKFDQFFDPTKSDITRNAEHIFSIKYYKNKIYFLKKQREKKFTLSNRIAQYGMHFC